MSPSWFSIFQYPGLSPNSFPCSRTLASSFSALYSTSGRKRGWDPKEPRARIMFAIYATKAPLAAHLHVRWGVPCWTLLCLLRCWSLARRYPAKAPPPVATKTRASHTVKDGRNWLPESSGCRLGRRKSKTGSFQSRTTSALKYRTSVISNTAKLLKKSVLSMRQTRPPISISR